MKALRGLAQQVGAVRLDIEITPVGGDDDAEADDDDDDDDDGCADSDGDGDGGL